MIAASSSSQSTAAAATNNTTTTTTTPSPQPTSSESTTATTTTNDVAQVRSLNDKSVDLKYFFQRPYLIIQDADTTTTLASGLNGAVLSKWSGDDTLLLEQVAIYPTNFSPN